MKSAASSSSASPAMESNFCAAGQLPETSARCGWPLTVLEETADYIVIDKPAGLLVHPSKPSHQRTLWHELHRLLAYEVVCGGQVSIINRLDRETSGVTLIAKTRAAAQRLCGMMERHELRKEYTALVWGWPAEECWRVEAPLLRQGEVQPSRIYLKQMVHPGGAVARSEFEVVRRFEKLTPAGTRFCFVRARPLTGRMHQLRVHLANSGHPVVGDKLYGPSEECYLEFIEHGWTPGLAERLLLPRQALHSARLEIIGTATFWEAPWPNELSRWAEDLPTEAAAS